jgi:hypothetical protein
MSKRRRQYCCPGCGWLYLAECECPTPKHDCPQLSLPLNCPELEEPRSTLIGPPWPWPHSFVFKPNAISTKYFS